MTESKALKYGRAVVKLSGESLAGDRGFGIEPPVIEGLTREIEKVYAAGVRLGVVVGGGNIVRGTVASSQGMDRGERRLHGDARHRHQRPRTPGYAGAQRDRDPRDERDPHGGARRALHPAPGGTGNPYFSTDTAAVLRAIEIEADVILKATKVDGVYTADPETHPDAEFIPRISYLEVMTRELGVMDAAAVSLCKENDLPVIVLNIRRPGAILSALKGDQIGTIVEKA
jgi:uridylate kinase